MKSRQLKHWLTFAGFVVLSVAMILALNHLLKPKWSTEYGSGTNIRGFYEMPRDSVDVLVLGSSNVICGVNANLMLSESGISAYTCGTESQPLFGSYAWLLEAERLHDLKAVVLDVGDLFDEFDEASYRKVFDNMHLSPLKLQLLREYRDNINPDADYMSYVLPLILYHSRFDELTGEDLSYRRPALKGFFLRTEERGKTFSGIGDPASVAAAEIPAEHEMYFLKIIEYCDAHEIPLILICGPSIKVTAEEHKAAAEIAEANGLVFLDFNAAEQWPEIDYSADMADFQHFNLSGANKATLRITDILNTLCSLPDRSADPVQMKLAAEYLSALSDAQGDA